MKCPFIFALSILAGATAFGESTPAVTAPAVKGAVVSAPSSPALGVGAHFDQLHVRTRTYRDVRVRDVTVRSILISDTDGIASIPLRDLPIELQKAFGYQPAREAASNAKIAIAEQQAQQAERLRRQAAEAAANKATSTKFIRLLKSFGQTPDLQPVVDLRSRFRELTLGVKDQGRRPSCAVFAIVSAYEFENAELLGHAEKLSEDYLIWATCQTLKRAPQLISSSQLPEDHDESEKDMGFSYLAVLESLSVFGIAPQSDMPNTYGKFGEIPAPSPELIRDSSMRRKLSIHVVPGSDNATQLANIVQAIDEGVPVPIGLRWPSERTLRTGYLDTQTPIPNYRHAVTIVGYACPTGQLENTEFIFKNSYGPGWGEAGYGRASFKYLSENLLGAVVLEVKRPDAATAAVAQK